MIYSQDATSITFSNSNLMSTKLPLSCFGGPASSRGICLWISLQAAWLNMKSHNPLRNLGLILRFSERLVVSLPFYQTCISSDVLRLTFIVTVNGLLLNKICRTSLKWTAFLQLSFTSSTHKTNNLWWLCCREPQCCQQRPSQHITNLPKGSETNQSNWSDKPEWYFKDAKLFLLPLRGWPRLVFYHILRRVGALREGVISVIGMVVLIKVLLSRGVMMIGPTME